MIKKALLIRVEQTAACSRGVLILGGKYICMTLERPWLDNKPNVSCIPSGIYTCNRINSPHFGETFDVSSVPGRSHILFHSGNTPADTEGCIIVGRTLVPHIPDIRDSRAAHTTLMAALDGIDSFTLEIV